MDGQRGRDRYRDVCLARDVRKSQITPLTSGPGRSIFKRNRQTPSPACAHVMRAMLPSVTPGWGMRQPVRLKLRCMDTVAVTAHISTHACVDPSGWYSDIEPAISGSHLLGKISRISGIDYRNLLDCDHCSSAYVDAIVPVGQGLWRRRHAKKAPQRLAPQ